MPVFSILLHKAQDVSICQIYHFSFKINFMSHKKDSKHIKKRKNAFFFFKFCGFIGKQVIDLPQK